MAMSRSGLGLCDGCVLADFRGVIHTEILDESVFIRHVLNVTGKDVNSQLLHVFGGINHNLVGEGIAVRVNGPQCKGAV